MTGKSGLGRDLIIEPGSRAAPVETVPWFADPRCIDVDHVGGKNASLANMTCTLPGAGIRVPPGFAVTAADYRSYLRTNEIETRLRGEPHAYHTAGQSLAYTLQTYITLRRCSRC